MSGETTTPQDPLPEKGPASEKGSTSAEGQVFTAEQLAKLKSDAAAEAGRLRKAAELERDTAKQELDSLKERLDRMEAEERERKLEAYKGDPAKLEVYQKESSLTEKERKLLALERDITRREASIKEMEERARAAEAEIRLREVTAKFGVPLEEAKELGINDPAILEKVLSKFKAAPPKEEPKNEADEWFNSFKPDSGVTAGGSGKLSVESAKKMSIEELEKALLKTR